MPLALVDADEAALEEELFALDARDEALLVRDASSDDRELALDPVAVASTELMDEASLLSSEVMEETADSPALLIEERAEDSSELADDMALARLEALLGSTELLVVVVVATD